MPMATVKHTKTINRLTRQELEQADKVLKPPRILLAEDEDELRSLLGWALSKDGYEVILAHDGVELLDFIALSLLKCASEEPVELIVTDIRMPGWNGLQILEGIRAADWSIPVILITAFGDVEIHHEALRLGAAAIFDKPFEIQDLRACIANLVPRPPIPPQPNTEYHHQAWQGDNWKSPTPFHHPGRTVR